MATIRAYTTIEQSRKLAEILPIESADMYWDLLSKSNYAKVNNIGCCLCRTCVYAWSLAALLSVLPDTINGTESYCRLTIDKEGDAYNISYDDILSEESIILYTEYSLIDACVAMIEKLHELNLL